MICTAVMCGDALFRVCVDQAPGGEATFLVRTPTEKRLCFMWFCSSVLCLLVKDRVVVEDHVHQLDRNPMARSVWMEGVLWLLRNLVARFLQIRHQADSAKGCEGWEILCSQGNLWEYYHLLGERVGLSSLAYVLELVELVELALRAKDEDHNSAHENRLSFQPAMVIYVERVNLTIPNQ